MSKWVRRINAMAFAPFTNFRGMSSVQASDFLHVLGRAPANNACRTRVVLRQFKHLLKLCCLLCYGSLACIGKQKTCQ